MANSAYANFQSRLQHVVSRYCASEFVPYESVSLFDSDVYSFLVNLWVFLVAELFVNFYRWLKTAFAVGDFFATSSSPALNNQTGCSRFEHSLVVDFIVLWSPWTGACGNCNMRGLARGRLSCFFGNQLLKQPLENAHSWVLFSFQNYRLFALHFIKMSWFRFLWRRDIICSRVLKYSFLSLANNASYKRREFILKWICGSEFIGSLICRRPRRCNGICHEYHNFNEKRRRRLP